jgi:serine/threonine protein kinase
MTRCTRCFADLLDLAVFCPQCSQPHEPDFDQLLNRSLDGRYHLYRRLGEGGMSTVFAATDIRSDQIAVVKISDPRHLVRRELTQSFDAAEARRYWAEMIERMRRKAIALSSIHHPHIVRILDTNPLTEDLRYVVMEFLRGQTLREEIEAEGRLDLATLKRIALEVADGLSAIHARGIVHRDLNPRNIFLCEAGDGCQVLGVGDEKVMSSPILNTQHLTPTVKVIDFGIAKIPQPPGAPPFTQHAVMSGTVAYASPEQCRQGTLDHRSDIYSLGVVLYEMATGERPFNGRTPTEIALQQLQAEPIPPRAIAPDLPVGLEAAILRALAKDPQARQQNIEELAAELRALSHRMVVSLGQEAGEAAAAPPLFTEVNATPTIDATESFDQVERFDEAEPEGQRMLIVKRRRRRAVAMAGLALLLAAAGVLLGKQQIAARRMASAPQEIAKEANTTASPAANETSTGVPLDDPKPLSSSNDADALEIAASISTLESAASPASTPNASTRIEPSPNRASPPATKTPHPATLPPTKPQAPPTPAPEIAAQREHQPISEPDYDHGPKPEPPAATRPREAGPPRAESPSSTARGDEREAGNNGSAPIYQPSHPIPRPARPADTVAEREAEVEAWPKVISWNGKVDREREITLEVPAVPGTIDIPRDYRKRVGMIEPPSPQNGWRRVVLRVFGKGPVSIVVRWFPRVSRIARADERE